jgi:hypothetical protein
MRLRRASSPLPLADSLTGNRSAVKIDSVAYVGIVPKDYQTCSNLRVAHDRTRFPVGGRRAVLEVKQR